MGTDRNLISTSISIPQSLLERAKVRAAFSYRTFSQYVSYLIDQDLSRTEDRFRTADRREIKQPADLTPSP